MKQIFKDKANFGFINPSLRESRSFIENVSGLKVEVESLKDFFSSSKVLSNCTFLPNHLAKTKVPYIKSNSANWKKEGQAVYFNDGMSHKEFNPYRLTLSVEVSKQLLQQNDGFDLQLKSYLIKAVEEKLIESILVSSQGEEGVRPNGIFYQVPKSPLSSLNDIIDLSYNLELTKNDNLSYLISPKAKQMILKEDNKAFDNDKLFGRDFILENKLEDGLVAYLDLSKLIITQFGETEIVIDPYRRAVDGLYVISLNSWYDFAYLDEDFLRVGDFNFDQDNENSGD